MKKKKEPKYIIRNVYYGEKSLADCMKAVIKNKLSEEIFTESKNNDNGGDKLDHRI